MPDVAGRVSLIVWRDPKKDPPEDKRQRVLVISSEHPDGNLHFRVVTPACIRQLPGWYEQWAALHAPSEATVSDLRNVLALANTPSVPAGSAAFDSITRLRALLPEGE